MSVAAEVKNIESTYLELREKCARFLEGIPKVKAANGKEQYQMTTDQHTEFRNMSDALNVAHDDYERLLRFERQLRHDDRVKTKAKNTEFNEELICKRLIDQIQERDQSFIEELKSQQSWSRTFPELSPTVFRKWAQEAEIKANFVTGTSIPLVVRREGSYVPAASKVPVFIDYLSDRPGSNPQVVMRTTTRTNSAAPTAEGSAGPESTLIETEFQYPMVNITHNIPVSEQSLEDVDETEGIITEDLPLMVYQKLNEQALVGSGAGGNMTGVYTAASTAYVKGTVDAGESVADALMHGIRLVTKNAETPSGSGQRKWNANLVVVPTDEYFEMVMLKDANGRFILGDPMTTPDLRLLGVPVVHDNNLAANTGLVLDTNAFPLRHARGVTLQAGYSGNDFSSHLIRFRAHCRYVVRIEQPLAAIRVTSL